MRLTSLRVKNYGCLADFELTDIPPLAIFVGANGSGKSTLFDIFAFLRDALRDDVRVAVANRGGYQAVHSHGADGPIEFEIKAHHRATTARMSGPPTADLTYRLMLDDGKHGPHVVSECLDIDARDVQVSSGPTSDRFERSDVDLMLRPGATAPGGARDRLWLDQPFALVYEAVDNGVLDRFFVDMPDGEQRQRSRRRRVEMLLLRKFEGLIEGFRQLLRRAYFSNIDPSAAKVAGAVAAGRQVSERGDNLANVVWQQTPGDALTIARKFVPGFVTARAQEMFDGRVGLRFIESNNSDGYQARNVSDGTVKLLAYALLLNESERHPLLCIEEPENYLYPKLLWPLIEEIREYSENDDTQVLVSTHSPDLVDAADPDEVFWLVKEDGATKAFRVSDDPQLVDEHDYGEQLGFMWRTGSFKGAHP